MGRLTRKTAILAKIEATYGVDPTPTGAANAMLISNQNIEPLKANNVDRNVVRSFLGGSEQLVGTANVAVSFDVELAGSGTAGTAPAWGPLLRACGFAEVVSAGTLVTYNPISDNFESVTIYYYDDGTLHKLLGARGTVDLKMGVGERPVMSFKFEGLDGGPAAAANPTQTLTAFKAPVVITDANAGDIILGCTYAAGAFTGGTTYASRGLQISGGIDVKYIPMLGGESVEVTGRNMTGKVTLDLTSAQEVAALSAIKANTLSSLGFSFGTVAGNKLMVYAPAVQRINPTKADQDGRRLIANDLRLTPVAGNDEMLLVVL